MCFAFDVDTFYLDTGLCRFPLFKIHVQLMFYYHIKYAAKIEEKERAENIPNRDTVTNMINGFISLLDYILVYFWVQYTQDKNPLSSFVHIQL